MKKYELLVPAGGEKQFIAAVENGADAVYMGGLLYNARMGADNFTADQIGKVKDVTVNGTSVLGANGVAAITIADLEADFVSVTTTDSAWTTKKIDGTDYKAITVEKTLFKSSEHLMILTEFPPISGSAERLKSIQ